jgi:hypothetical protein
MNKRRFSISVFSIFLFVTISCISEPAGGSETPTATPPSATLDIGNPTPTPTLTDTPFPSNTAAPTETATSTETAIPILFEPVTFSTEQLWQGGESCSPQTITVQIRITPSEMVSSVGLFFRIKAKSGNHDIPWGGAWPMIPQGSGWYTLSFAGNDLPDVDDWWEDAWLDFQFVAFNANKQPIARSEVYRKVTLSQCYV